MFNLYEENRRTDPILLQEWKAHDALPSKSGYTLDDNDMALLSELNHFFSQIFS